MSGIRSGDNRNRGRQRGGRGVADGSGGGRTGPRRLTDLYSRLRMVSGYASVVQIDPLLPAAPASGKPAWYGVQSIEIGEEIPEDVAVLAMRVTMLPTNPNANQFDPVIPEANTAAWGDLYGLKAGVVVGVNLPIEYGKWGYATSYVPGVGSLLSAQQTSPYLAGLTFPPGELGGASVEKHTVPIMFAPAAEPLARGDRLDVALLIDGAQAFASRGDFWTGLVQVDIHLADTVRPDEFGD
ncbi:MAG: hypothetical protein AAFP26_01060 [Planctomycetota bacterium]